MDAYEKAISLLSLREHTEKEIRLKLDAKGYQDPEIDSAVARIRQEGYLSEERFAESYIRSRMRRNPEGKAILSMRLREKGCPEPVIRDALSKAWEEGLYMDPLKKLYLSKEERSGREKALAYIMRKGFSSSDLRSALES